MRRARRRRDRRAPLEHSSAEQARVVRDIQVEHGFVNGAGIPEYVARLR